MPDASRPIAIVDYGVGNLFSVRQACAAVGLQAPDGCIGIEDRDPGAREHPGHGRLAHADRSGQRNHLHRGIASRSRSS